MQTNSNIERGRTFVDSLPNDWEGVERAQAFNELLTDSVHSDWAREAAIGAYHLAGADEWNINSLYDLNMITTAIARNFELLPDVRDDIERVYKRFGLLSSKSRSTWTYILEQAALAIPGRM